MTTQKNEIEDMEHSRVGASSCHQWWECPGSVQAQQGKEDTTGKSAARGTVGHHINETALKKGFTKAQVTSEFLNKTFKQDGHNIKVDMELIEDAWLCIDTIRKDIAGAEKEFGLVSGYKYLGLEEPVHLKHIDEAAFGTNDARLAIPFKRLTIYDYKFGFNEVDVVENKQLSYYSLQEVHEGDYVEVELVVIQPKSFNPVKRWVTTPEWMNKFGEELGKKIRATRAKAPEYKAGEKQCKWCKAKLDCPAQRQLITKSAQMDFEDLTEVKPVEEFTLEQLVEIKKAAPIIDGFLKAVGARLKEQADKGVKIPGHKLIDDSGNRVWEDEKAVEDKFYKEHGESIYAPPKPKVLRSPAQMEKLVGKKGGVDELTIKPYKGTKLVHSGHKAPEAKSAIDADFEAIK